MATRKLSSLFADTSKLTGNTASFLKTAQEQPDNVQFAQDFSNLAFQFLQDRAPALMKYILGFEVVDRAENGTRAVGIFGFKIDGNYYYVPAFFMNSQVKGVNSILSKRTNSFVPLTEAWVNYIINRKANELGKEAPNNSQNEPSQFENPNFDFLQRPTVGPLGGPPYSMGTVGQKVASASDEKPWKFSEAWDHIRHDIEKCAGDDPEFKKAFAGFFLSFSGVRSPLAKEASSPIQDYIEKIGGPTAEATFMRALHNVDTANAALEFYVGPKAFHVEKYANAGADNYMLRKRAQEISEKTPKVKITSSAQNEDEAREILEDGFVIQDKREPERKSRVIETDYESNFQNPDLPGIYNVLVQGGKTVKAYILSIDPLINSNRLLVYFPSNKQVIHAYSKEVLTEGGAIGSLQDIYSKSSSIADCKIGNTYVLIGKKGTVLPGFHINNATKVKGERPVLSGHFCYNHSEDFRANPNDDFENYWRGDRFHNINGSLKNPDISFVSSLELADFVGRPKWTGGSLTIPSDWRALQEGEDTTIFYDSESDESKVRYTLGTLNSLSLELRKEGAANLNIMSDGGLDYYISFDGGRYTQPYNYKQACITLVTRLGLDPKDAKHLLKKASVERKSKCLVKLGQLVGVSTQQPREQTPEVDPYTGIPVYQSPFYDQTQMPFFGNDPSVSLDNQLGENIGGDIQRQSEAGASNEADEAEFDPEAAQLAQEAGRLGQKDVFDKAAIGGLAKVYDTGAVIDSYIPEFMQSLDRIGRVLFLYYWKHNDFVSRYGTDDVVEMEDVLKNVFNNLGKLTLDLKSKAVGGGDSQTGEDII